MEADVCMNANGDVHERVRTSCVPAAHRLLVLLAASLAGVAPTAADDSAPSGDEIIHRFVEVSGGREAYASIRNRVILAKLDLPDHGWEGELAEIFVPPDYRRVIVIDNYRPVVHGINHGKPWQRTPLGPRNPLGQGPELAGVNAADLKLLGQLNPFLDWSSAPGKARVEREIAIEGEDCFRVEVTLPDGHIVYAYFSKETGLLRQLHNFNANLFRYYDDYREHDGVLIPHNVHVDAGMIMMGFEFIRIEQNVDLTQLSVEDLFQTIEIEHIPGLLGIAEDGSLQEPMD